MSKVTDIIIADTIGNHLTDAYRELLPDVELIGYPHPDEPSVNYPVHNHGAWCGWLAGLPCQIEAMTTGKKFRIHFVPMFRPNGTAYPDGMLFLMEHIRKIRPQYVSRSFGAWDQDDRIAEIFLKSFFDEYAAEWFKLQDEIGFVDFAAAGNNDRNDADNDIAAPQKYMPDRSLIVGSVSRAGLPSIFSGDGKGVLCAMWGEKVISPGLDGRWYLWSGTSATCPKLCGVAAAKGLDREGVVSLVKETATFPSGFTRPHDKWGWGTCEHLWQMYARLTPAGLWPSSQAELQLQHSQEIF